jgi:lysophospholipase L1-like esterase
MKLCLRALVLIVVTVTAAALVVSPAHAAAPAGRYVALGDSYTSGPLIPDQVDLNCVRSNRNYPSLVARAIGSASFADVSCGGATTGDILNAGKGTLGLPVPAQLSAVTAATALVTIGIGGNDIGFSGIVSACAQDGIGNPFGTPCRDRYTSGGTDQLQARIAAAEPKVAAVIRAVRSAAPNARIVVVGYPTIVPDSGYGCWPTVPFAFGDVPYLRSVARSLNAMLARTAAAGGAEYADTYTPSIGHDVCRGRSVRWVEGVVPENPAAPFHPNAAGEQGMATAVTARLAA